MEARTITLDQTSSPPVEHFACGNLFPFGKASVLYAPQGAGKSAFLSQLAFTFAGHQGLISTFLGMDIREGGPVVVFSAEDTYDDWIRKAAAYRSAAPDASTALARALSRVHIIDKTEGVARFTEMVQLRAGSAAESMLRREARTTAEWRKLRDFAIEKGARLIIVETTSRLLDDEDNANMAALIGALGYLASETGAVVVLSHHPTKAASQTNDSSPEAARGGSALINNSRTAVSLFPAQGEVLTQWRGMFAEQDVLSLEHAKSTSSVRRQAPITLIRCPTPYGAILRLPEDALKDASPVVAEVRRKTVVAEEAAKAARFRRIYDVVRKFKEVNGGPLSANKLIDYKDQLGVGKNRVSLLVDEALEAGVLVIKTTDSKGRILDMIPGQRPADPAPEN